MIRAATLDDLKPLAELYKELMIYHNSLDPEGFKIPDDATCEKKVKYHLDNADNDSIPKLICHDTNGIVDAYALYEIFTPYLNGKKLFEADPSISIEQIIVSENARRKGIGTELIHGLLDIAKKDLCTALYIKVHANNDSARQFYEKLGLVPKSINMEMRL